MKKALLTASILILAYVAAGPYLTISAIKTGIVDQDSVKLSENIDFQSLRQNLKDQFNAVMIKNVAEPRDNPFSVLAAGLATTMTDKIVDSLITPNGMASAMSGNPLKQDDAQGARSRSKEDLFKNARYSYDSINNFSVWIPVENAEDVRLVLERDSLTWKLVNIIVPSI